MLASPTNPVPQASWVLSWSSSKEFLCKLWSSSHIPVSMNILLCYCLHKPQFSVLQERISVLRKADKEKTVQRLFKEEVWEIFKTHTFSLPVNASHTTRIQPHNIYNDNVSMLELPFQRRLTYQTILSSQHNLFTQRNRYHFRTGHFYQFHLRWNKVSRDIPPFDKNIWKVLNRTRIFVFLVSRRSRWQL
jgi:hypothetical protein